MLILAVLRLWFPVIPLWLVGLFAWSAMLLLIPQLKRVVVIPASILFILGMCCVIWANQRGITPDWQGLLSRNSSLLALLAGVSFLRLVTMPASDEAEDTLPRGEGAFLRTVLGTHLFSAVINLSILLIVADRLQRNQTLSRDSALPITRAFTAAAFWSPFFAAMGVALSYAPGASLVTLVLWGLPLAGMGLIYTLWEVRRTSDIEQFRGYPINFSLLWIPSVLVIVVLWMHQFKPEYPIIVIVAGAAILLTVLILLFKSIIFGKNISKASPLKSLSHHAFHELPKMSGELTLFLTAGVLAVGLSSLLQTFEGELLINVLSFPIAVSLLLSMVGLAILGIHPIISIAIVGTLLESVQVDSNLLGMIFLSTWAIGILVSPLSGMNLALMGRYSLQAKEILSWHWRYTLFMLALVSLLLWVRI